MKKIAAMVLAGVLAAVPVSTTGAAEFQDGADTQNFIWAAGEETSTDTDESKGVSANDSVVEGLDKPLVFYPNTYYKFNVTGAGTQNTNPVEGDVRWTPLYWSLSLKQQESDNSPASHNSLRQCRTRLPLLPPEASATEYCPQACGRLQIDDPGKYGTESAYPAPLRL